MGKQIFTDREYLEQQFTMIHQRINSVEENLKGDISSISTTVDSLNVLLIGDRSGPGLLEKTRTLQRHFLVAVGAFSVIGVFIIITHIQEAANNVVRFLEKRFF